MPITAERPAVMPSRLERLERKPCLHTCASLLFERSPTAKQAQRWIGHHSAPFTLDTHFHLLEDRLGEPLEIESEQLRSSPQHATATV